MLIGIVGPCGAGKSTLAAGLSALGYEVRCIAQEHSYVPAMWQKITNPGLLIYLDVSYENTILRRKLNWTYDEYAQQIYRLRHAREYADYYIDTNTLNILEVKARVLEYIQHSSTEHPDE